MATKATVVLELHVTSRIGTASVHLIPCYTGYDADDSLDHYSEHADIKHLIGPINRDAASELAQKLTAALAQTGLEVELIDVCDD